MTPRKLFLAVLAALAMIILFMASIGVLSAGCRGRTVSRDLIQTVQPKTAPREKLFASVGDGRVHLRWVPSLSHVQPGDTLSLGLWALGDHIGFTVADLVFAWNPAVLTLAGVTGTGPYAWLNAEFFDDRYVDGWNITHEDGDAYYTLWARPSPDHSTWPVATPGGLLLVTFEFVVAGPVVASAVSLLEFDITEHTVDTSVLVGSVDVLGTTRSASVQPAKTFTIVDHTAFVGCMSGPGTLPLSSDHTTLECLTRFDVDGDFDGDLADWRVFQAGFEGP